MTLTSVDSAASLMASSLDVRCPMFAVNSLQHYRQALERCPLLADFVLS